MPNQEIEGGERNRPELSENELRLLFENMISPFSYYRMVYDAEGRAVDYIFLAVNKAFELETGQRREDVIGKHVRSVYPQTEPYWIECFGRVAKTGVSEHISQYSAAFNKWYSALVYSPKPDHVAITIVDISQYVSERDALAKIAQELRAQQTENFLLAHVEPISGLPNRNCLNDALAERMADSNAGPFSLAIIGPDNLVEILASYGSVLSDRIMFDLSQRLRAICQPSEELFSMTGTDLVLLQPDDGDRQTVRDRLTQFLNAIREPIIVEGMRYYLSATCGVAGFPSDGTERDDLIMKANLALYQAKKSGETILFYSEQIGSMLLRRTQIRNALPKAMIHREFELYYQPQIEVSSGRIIGVEALLRWHSPELGEVPPGEFIGIAEKSRLILPLGKWVLETACAAAKRLERERNIQLRMAVNVSGVQLTQSGFFEDVTGLLRSFELAPDRLELEITESVVLSRETGAMQQLNRLHASGIRIALDDFGTGYSTMSLLKDLRVATIKIDQTFIQDPTAPVMNHVIVRLGHILGAKVVAEGVETPEQMDCVRQIGCDAAQGFLLSVPLPFDELLQLIESKQSGVAG